MTRDDQDAIHQLVNRNGIFAVIDHVSNVCGIKAHYTRAVLGNYRIADNWETAGQITTKTASSFLDLDLDHKEE